MTGFLPRASSRCAALCGVIWTILATPARADSPPITGECVAANESAQSLRRDGKFDDARAQLMMCVQPSCPELVRSDCAHRLDELNQAEPGLVLDVKDDAGNDVIHVTVTVDGRLLTDKLTGTAIAIDPGVHDFTFQVEGRQTITRQLLVREGDKARHELVVFRTTRESRPPLTSEGRTQRNLGFVAGGVGVAGLALGAVFGLLASSAKSAQQSDCNSTSSCTNRGQAVHDHDRLETDASASTVAFIGGGALLATGVVLLLTTKRPNEEPRAAWTLAPGVGPSGLGVSMRGAF